MNNAKSVSHLYPDNGGRPHLVRSDTSRGGWATFYTVDSEGNAILWERQTRYEPMASIRARVSASLGGGKGVRP